MKARIISWVTVIVLSVSLGAAAVVGIEQLRPESTNTSVISQSVPSTTTGVSSTTGTEDLADLYAQVRPSIVTVEGSSRTAGGLGSGIILDKQGHILTNNHVIDGFTSLDVRFADGSSYSAKVVGTDPGNDIAVIQVQGAPASSLVPALLGDSDKIRVGELAVAVGNPLNLSGSVTQGIISGVGRSLDEGTGGRPLRALIQSDAAINPGNSGGALFNKNGEVIGITTAIDNSNNERAFAGIGYSVPINTAKRFLPALLQGQTISHPKIGVVLQDLTPAVASTLGLGIDHGVLITTIEANSAAAKAGLRGGTGSRGSGVGDVIVSIDGKQVDTYAQLADYLDSKSVGDKIQIKLVRDGKDVTVDLTLEAWKA